MTIFIPHQCSEREPGRWEDCAWCAGVMFNNAAHGRNVAPSTRAEYQALRVAGGDGPAENDGDGSNNDQVRTGIIRRYGWAPLIVGPPAALHVPFSTIATHLATPGAIASLQGSMGVWSYDSHWRRHDRQFNGPHSVFVERVDGQSRVWWMNPQAPNDYAGEWMTFAELQRFYDSFVGGALFSRVGLLATPQPAPPPIAPPTDIAIPKAIGKRPAGATMWVETERLERLWRLASGVMRPIAEAKAGQTFTFEAWAGPNERHPWSPGTVTPKQPDTVVFRRIDGPPHAGLFVRVTDAGSIWNHL